jgi:hypothetical protein
LRLTNFRIELNPNGGGTGEAEVALLYKTWGKWQLENSIAKLEEVPENAYEGLQLCMALRWYGIHSHST